MDRMLPEVTVWTYPTLNSFWQRPDVKQEMIGFLTTQISTKRIYDLEIEPGKTRQISFQAKLIEGVPNVERKLLVMIKFA